MKTALITTTINVPHVLALYRKYGPDVEMFVAFDEKTPKAAAEFCGALSTHCRPFDVAHQRLLEYKCSELLGWNCIQRRNIALLEAIKWGAEIIVSIDDDNIPIDPNYFMAFEHPLTSLWNGLKADSLFGWFDVGQLLQPKAPHRGFPYGRASPPTFDSVTDAKVGVAAGVCLGDPDIGAVERIANGPTVHGVSELLRSGVVVDTDHTWTVFNTQNTAFIRELAPAMFCPPGIGRYDDIVASLVTQRVMREKNLHVHFGKPFIWQQRNQHSLTKDLEAELWGMLNIVNVANLLDQIQLLDETVPAQVRRIYQTLAVSKWFPKPAAEAALTFCDDVEAIL